MQKDKTKILILAAGKGKRMESDLPKSLMPLKGKPMILHVIGVAQKISNEKPIAIVGHKAEMVKERLGDLCDYVLQKELLGTGYAVSCAKDACKDAEHVIVLSGDQPFITAKTIEKLVEKHLASGAKITFTSAEVEDFLDWRKAFMGFGRVLRENDKVIGVREYKDATDGEKQIKEVNAGCYCFEANWLWENLEKIKNDNSQKEYYLTELFQIAKSEGVEIETIKINAHEALGANTKEELAVLEEFAI